MAQPEVEALRESARHRGLRLKASRRRKPGGDFGKFGLTNPAGEPVFGIDEGTLTATAEAIAGYLRGVTRADWQGSTKGLKRKATPKPPPPLPPKQKFKPAIANLFAKLPAARRAEAFTELAASNGMRVERIVSRGQATPADAPMVQDHDEWVAVLQGEASLRIADSDEVTLRPGDYVTIARGQPHWVTRTSADPPTVWLAVHF